MKLSEKIVDAIMKLGGALPQGSGHHNPEKTVTAGMPELLRAVAAEGAVLLENRVLPFEKGKTISLFGRVQCDWFCTGYGSGGDVNAPYKTSLLDGLRKCEQLKVNEQLAAQYEQFSRENPVKTGIWGAWPRFYPEMPLSQDMVCQAAKESDAAVVVIGRAAGEDRENTLKPGSYYLTSEERKMLQLVTQGFEDPVLVLNIGAVMDLSFLDEFRFGAVLLLWQGGMESGNAAADLLCGKACPSGRLTDTIARKYEHYPSADCFGKRKRTRYHEDIYVGYRWFETFAKEDVRYPFGYGLSYTKFSRKVEEVAPLHYRVTVKNEGDRYTGKETVLVYVQKPCGDLGNPARELVAYGKTKALAPGEGETLEFTLDESQFASYDDSGITGNPNCYVLQEGVYRIYIGGNVRQAPLAATYTVAQTRVLMQAKEAAAPQKPFPIAAAKEKDGVYTPHTRMAAGRVTDLKTRILDNLPPSCGYTGDKGYKLRDVKVGKISLDTFTAQLDKDELEAISRGAYIMGSPLGAKGNAGVFGGVTESLRQKGIPPITTTDGPSGIRLYDSCSLLPIGTLLACTFDAHLLEKLGCHLGDEMKEKGSDVLLAPGMNIHRNVLCGRNFEYFSEDPVVSGITAAALVRGIQSTGVSACPKHFACNNQEFNRFRNDSVVSQRALREIYLKGFEICVKTAKPKNIMTSYNKINGVWGHYHYDLVKTILRDEWGYEGNVITDWWMQSSRSPEFPKLRDNAYRVRACVDVLMPGSRRIDFARKPDGTLLRTFGKPHGITLGELQYCAKNVLRCAMALKNMEE
jgi:beta-glucosidase